jgi:hypothetical protein
VGKAAIFIPQKLILPVSVICSITNIGTSI